MVLETLKEQDSQGASQACQDHWERCLAALGDYLKEEARFYRTLQDLFNGSSKLTIAHFLCIPQQCNALAFSAAGYFPAFPVTSNLVLDK